MYLIVLGLAIHVLLPQITSLEDSIHLLRTMSPWLVSLACLAQIGSYLGNGYLVKSIVDLGQTKLSLRRGLSIALASGSIGLIGGWGGAGAATYRWVAKEKSTEVAVLTGILPPFFNEIVLVVVTIIALIFLLIDYHLSHTLVISYSLFLFLISLTLLIIIYAMKHQATMEPVVLRLVERLMHSLRRSYDPTPIRNAMDNLYRGFTLLDNKGWIRPALGAILNVGFDMLTLHFLFLATTYKIHPGVLLAGYGLAFLLGKVAYIVPGGVGIIESGMAAVYSSLGVPKSVSVVAILSYRLFSFWIPTVFGFVAAGYLEREATRENTEKILKQSPPARNAEDP